MTNVLCLLNCIQFSCEDSTHIPSLVRRAFVIKLFLYIYFRVQYVLKLATKEAKAWGRQLTLKQLSPAQLKHIHDRVR